MGVISRPSGLQRDAATWCNSRAAVEGQSRIHISGSGIPKVDGSYSYNYRENDDQAAPAFRCAQFGRWMYFDGENRWRVGLLQHMGCRKGGDAGYLRSEPMKPGMLPTDDFTRWESFNSGEWVPCTDVRIEGVQTPEKVVTISTIPGDLLDDLIEIACHSMAGNLVASARIDSSKQRVSDLRQMLADEGCPRCKLVTPEGRFLSRHDDKENVANLFTTAAKMDSDIL